MTVKVTIELDRKFSVSADQATVFKLLADVPESASHFPKVETLTDLGDNSYRWEMEKVGLGSHSVQTIYACKYSPDESTGIITWSPIKGDGNGVVSGSWKVTGSANGTDIHFKTTSELSLPLPGLLKLAISPVVKHEFSGMVDEYIENLKGVLA